MKKLLPIAAVAELATGVAFFVVPSLVARLLLGAELTGIALPVARVLGIALMALGVACLPGFTALGGMLTYSVLATGYLAWLAFGGEWVGPLFWPAVLAHAILTLLLARAWLTIRSAATTQQHT